jgi:LSD1 subclass zinc finger protein
MANFACPSCKKVLKSNDPMGGKTVRCPACQTTFVVPKDEPAPAPAAPAAPPPPMPAADPAPQAAAEEPPRWEPEKETSGDERPAKKKKFDFNLDKKTMILAGGAGGGLLVVFLFAAFVWPGFWLSGGAAAGLRYMPPDSTFIAGINFSSLGNAAFKKQIQNLGIRADDKGIHGFRELLQDSEWILIGHAEGEDFCMAIQKTRAPDLNAFRRKAKFGPGTKAGSEQYQG